MTAKEIKQLGWVQTDGSASTLQYGRKVNRTTWEYKQWCDKPWDLVYPTVEEKLNLWESGDWVSCFIDLKQETIGTIVDALDTFGYEVKSWGNNLENFVITQGRAVYDVEDSIQLTCECIFEIL